MVSGGKLTFGKGNTLTMIKCLFYGETPCIETGGGRVSQKILDVIKSLEWNTTVVGINHFPDIQYDRKLWPFHFIPTPFSDFYNLDNAKYQILAGDYDILFLTGDINHMADVMQWVEEARKTHTFKVFAHVAYDVDFDMTYIRELMTVDYYSCFSDYARKCIIRQCPELEGRLMVIPHWFEPHTLFPMDPKKKAFYRGKYFHKAGPDRFIVLSVNRNQYRKDLPRVMKAFHLFHLKHPDSFLYVHAKQNDIGGDLPTQAKLLGLTVTGPDTEVMFSHPNMVETVGVSRTELNEIYNACDVGISCAKGEGWGLFASEAMAAGLPFIGPDNTVFPEILGSGERGYLVPSGGDDLWTIDYTYGNEPRPLTSVTAMVEALETVYYDREDAKIRAKAARAYALDHHEWGYKETWFHLLTSAITA